MTHSFRTTLAAALVLTAGFALPAAAQTNPMVGGAPMYATKNIVENAVNSRDHPTLVAAVKAAEAVARKHGAAHPEVLPTSSETGFGIPELRAEIFAVAQL